MSRVIDTLALTVCVTLLLGSGVVDAQSVAAEDDVRTVNEQFYEAASARDLVKMDGLWAHEAYVRAIHPGLPIDEGWEEVRAGWESLFEYFSEISVSMPDPHIRIGDKVAWVTGREDFEGRNNAGEEVSETLLGTSIYELVNGKWQMVHHHVSGLPLPPE